MRSVDAGRDRQGDERDCDGDLRRNWSSRVREIGGVAVNTEWACILTFDDQSPSFALGFQAGEIWQETKQREYFETIFSGEILEFVQRMPARCNYDFEISPYSEGWFYLKATPSLDNRSF